ncbi:RagB/SusD family nutrient uptake outer membrane protein [Petrimonas sp.]|uniref:RagB/SusD family nutrient uptake outer membrane protein n=1 Tax=Petrimonas sp. TaxID=2023866 RepID=UPI003F515B29
MKKILLLAICLMFLSCENFLDNVNYTKQDDNSFPLTVDEANQLVVGVYNTLNEEISSYDNSAFFFYELASDERFGGGGTDNFNWQAISKLLNYGPDLFNGYWSNRYQGIFRTNVAFEKFDKIPWENDKQKNTAYGEIHFFRGYFYFTLVQFFENIPLILESLSGNSPQASMDEVYAQAAFDLKKAIELLPGDPYNSVEKGRVTRWAAQSIMARMFLFYTGFYNKNELPVAGGGTITKTQIVSWLEDCIANSGHDLVSDYRNLWPYTNQYTVEHYFYTQGKGLKWEGESNKEVVFATKCANGSGFRNGLCLAFTLRRPHGETLFPFPFTRGYGAGPVSPVLVNQWRQLEPTDIRRSASIFHADEYPGQYQWGGDNQAEETGYWQKKYMGIASKTSNGTYQHSYNVPMYGLSVSSATSTGAFTQDLIHIRFADVLLMHSELTGTKDGINRVRSRAGLDPIDVYSLSALKQERRFELCFENTRFNDIRRWGDAEALLEGQIGIPVKTTNLDSKITHQIGFGARYRATRGFWPIPQSQIRLSGNLLKQNEGWGTPEVEFTGL